MEEIKDIQANNSLKFLDTEIRTNPFGENRSGERAYRRAERIAAAIFLLTNHISPNESLRTETRTSAGALLQNVLSLRDEMRTIGTSKLNDLQATVRQLISQVRMLVFGGFVSSYNAEAVAGALDDLGNFISLSQRTTFSESIRISRDELLDVRDSYKGHLRDIKDSKNIKDKLAIKDKEETPSQAPSSRGSAITSRSNSILDILRTSGELNIRDIAGQLPEYGEKTIQRELGLLIDRGLVRRIGLKRWSRYTLAS